jgi:hypothetical protein
VRGIAVDVSGACPAPSVLERALSNALDVTASAGWALSVWREGGTTHLTLRAPDGAVAQRRAIIDSDCQAVARATALIVRRHLSGLELPANRRDADGTPPATGRSDDDGAAAGSASDPNDRSESTEPSERRFPLSTSLALSGGIALAFEPSAAAGALQLGLSVRTGPLFVRASVLWTSPRTRTEAGETVRLRHWRPALAVGLRWDQNRWTVRPYLGAGLAVIHAQAANFDSGAADRRLLPTVDAGLAVRFRVRSPLFVGLEGAASVLPLRERYLVEPAGEVARSPRADARLLAGAGLEW